MADPSTIFFPLRSNARTLYAGPGVERVRRRLKFASLLYDAVWIEAGLWESIAGPRGAMEGWPPTSEGVRWQTLRERSASKKNNFQVGFKLSNAPADAPFTGMVNTPVGFHWRATFLPFLNELPPSCDWIAFGEVKENAAHSPAVENWIGRDKGDDRLRRLLREELERNIVIESVNRDLGHGIDFHAAVSVDDWHARVMRARVEREEAAPAFGGGAFEIALPEAGSCSREEIAALRQHRGMTSLRTVLRDCEAAVWELDITNAEMVARVRAEFETALHNADMRLGEGWKGNIVTAATDFIVGTFAATALLGTHENWVAGLIGVATTATGSVLRAKLARPHWTAAVDAIRDTARK